VKIEKHNIGLKSIKVWRYQQVEEHHFLIILNQPNTLLHHF